VKQRKTLEIQYKTELYHSDYYIKENQEFGGAKENVDVCVSGGRAANFSISGCLHLKSQYKYLITSNIMCHILQSTGCTCQSLLFHCIHQHLVLGFVMIAAGVICVVSECITGLELWS